MEKLMILQGIVQKGMSRGKKLGFPTINFLLSHRIEDGIYVSQIVINNKQYNSLTFIGAAKTFDETKIQAETYVFDFDHDVYGEHVKVALIKKIRGNQRFDSEQELIAQMEDDKKRAEEFFKHL